MNIFKLLLFRFPESDFSQQKLPAWQPILTAGTVLPAFFVIGIAFVAIGVGLLHFSNQVLEYNVDYTKCTNSNGKMCKDFINETLTTNTTDKCICEVPIEIKEDMVSKSPKNEILIVI